MKKQIQKQYLFIYLIASYHATSDTYLEQPVAVLIPAKNDKTAKFIAERIWSRFHSLKRRRSMVIPCAELTNLETGEALELNLE